MTSPNSTHPNHDRFAIAGLVSGDLEPADLARARSQVEACADCARLVADLRAIRSATAAMPAPRRSRDFSLTPADAERLQPAGWRRLAAMLAGPRTAFTRPLAAGLMTVGLAGLILTTVPLPFGAAPATPLSDVGAPTGAEASREPDREIRGGVTAPGSSTGSALDPYGFDAAATPLASAAPPPAPAAQGGAEATDSRVDPPRTSVPVGPTPDRTLAVLFGSLAVSGLGLILLRWLAQRTIGA